MKIKLPKTDRILGVSAMIISIITLIIFIYQTNIINEQSKLSVKPHLSFDLTQYGNDSIITFTQYVRNKGLGPAIIKEAKVEFEGRDFPFYFDLFVYEAYPELETYGQLVSSTAITDYKVISPEESIVIYRIEIPRAREYEFYSYLGLDEVNETPDWSFEIAYTSMYEDELWHINDGENVPVKN